VNTQYRLWHYIKEHLRPHDLTESPLHINFNDIVNMKSKLHERVWIISGLVVQKIYYGEYCEATNEFSDPVIMEQWEWNIDSRLDTVNTRTINIQGFSDGDVNQLLPHTVTTIKHYTSISSKLKEIERRRYNRVYDLREIVIKELITGLSDTCLAQAIVDSTNLTYYLKDQVDEYIRFSNTNVCEALRNPSEHMIALFPYLKEDMDVPGIGSGVMHNVMADMLGTTSFETIKKLDRTLLV